jgi:hypothetical protein
MTYDDKSEYLPELLESTGQKRRSLYETHWALIARHIRNILFISMRLKSGSRCAHIALIVLIKHILNT